MFDFPLLYLTLIVCVWVNQNRIGYINNKAKHPYLIQFDLNPIFCFVSILQFWPYAILGNIDIFINASSWISPSISSNFIQIVNLGIWTLLHIVFMPSWKHSPNQGPYLFILWNLLLVLLSSILFSSWAQPPYPWHLHTLVFISNLTISYIWAIWLFLFSQGFEAY